MNDIIKVVKFLEKSGLLMKGVSETVWNKAKELEGGFLGMLLATLAVSLLGSASAGIWALRAGEGTIRAVYNF